LWDADGDGMCVGDGSVMDVRIKNEREHESIFISISHVQKKLHMGYGNEYGFTFTFTFIFYIMDYFSEKAYLKN